MAYGLTIVTKVFYTSPAQVASLVGNVAGI